MGNMAAVAPANFNPHSRVGSDGVSFELQRGYCHFNPHSRVGSDTWDTKGSFVEGISIHTPAWGATWVIEFERCDKPISIHTPAWGATLITDMFLFLLIFQSTLPRGERPENPLLICRTVGISIHTPAWGATTVDEVLPENTTFQSTLPRGERRSMYVTIRNYIDFNPHSRVGSDPEMEKEEVSA